MSVYACVCVCEWGTSSMCGQFQIFPAQPDPGQPHTEPGSCLSHARERVVYVHVQQEEEEEEEEDECERL